MIAVGLALMVVLSYCGSWTSGMGSGREPPAVWKIVLTEAGFFTI